MFFYRFWDNRTHNIYQSPDQKTKPGDLIFDGERYYLNLGDEISRPEQWYTTHTITISQTIPSLCSTKTLERIHRMVNERFSSYNKVISLFLWSDISVLLKHKKWVKSTKEQVKNPQHLLIFPSILSIQQYLNHHPESESPLILTWSSTIVQKAKWYRAIGYNTEQTILTTHSQIFQNRNHLTRITLMDEHSPYYRTFQDPRYNIPLTIAKLRELYVIS